MTAIRYYDVAAGAWKTITTAQGPPGPQGAKGDKGDVGLALLDVQRMFGQNNGYRTVTTGQQITVNAAATIGLQLVYTPPVDCWWEVDFHMGLVQKTDAAYHYMQPSINLSPADVDGIGVMGIDTLTQHLTVQTFEPHNMRALFKLAAGIAYTTYPVVAMSGGTWQYHQHQNHLSMFGKAWAR